MSGPAAGALQGLVVLDLTQMLSGPYATMLLADQGARVIKIEPPRGEDTRGLSPHPQGSRPESAGGYGGYFASINRNKESVVIDLKTDEGCSVFRRLVRYADIVIENFRAGVMDRLGLSYEQLAELNPRLVYAAIRGFGDARTGASPYLGWPAYDVVAQAMGGMMGITGPVPGGDPVKIGPGVGDIIPAMLCAFGLLAAQRHAERSGRGQFVDVAMIDAMLATCERTLMQYSYTGIVPRPEGNGHPVLCPFGMFPAKDGFVSIGCPTEKFWRELVVLMQQPELATDLRYATRADRMVRRDEVNELVAAWTSARTKHELTELLGGRIPFGPIFNAKEIFDDPHTAARGMLAEVAHPDTGRSYRIADTPIKMTLTPGGVRDRAPLLGEHTRAVLRDFAFGDDEIARLLRDRVVA